MNENDHVTDLLHRGADDVHVSRDIPAHVRRAVRMRQGFLVGAASLSLAALFVGAALSWTGGEEQIPQPVGPAEETPAVKTVTSLTSGREGGKRWEMDWHSHPAAERDRVCVSVGGSDPSCVGLSEMEGVTVGVGYLSAIERIAVVAKVPPTVHGIGIREIDGIQWAGLVADEGDPATGRPAFYYRFFDKDEVNGIVSLDSPDTPYIQFGVEVVDRKDRVNVRTSLGPVGTDVPELRGFPGTKKIVATGDEGGGYSVILRETDDEVCLHLASLHRCRSSAAVETPVRLALAVVRPCRPQDQCGFPGESPRYRELTIVAGEVAPGVERVGLRDASGTSFVQTSDAMRGPGEIASDARNVFSSVLYSRFGGEVVALDGDRELGSVRVVPVEQPDPRVEELERRADFLRRHLDRIRDRMEERPEIKEHLRRSERKYIRRLRQVERELSRFLERKRS